MSEETAYLMTNMLKNVSEQATVHLPMVKLLDLEIWQVNLVLMKYPFDESARFKIPELI